MDTIEARVRAQYQLAPEDAVPPEAFRRAIEQAAAEMRERCAKIAEMMFCNQLDSVAVGLAANSIDQIEAAGRIMRKIRAGL